MLGKPIEVGLDMLLIGALIEARSCERFAKLASRLPARLEARAREAEKEARSGDFTWPRTHAARWPEIGPADRMQACRNASKAVAI